MKQCVRDCKVANSLIAVALMLPFMLFFYWQTIASRFDLVFGDAGDTRFAALIMEHWFMVFSGNARFFSPIFFYPEPGAIGFTDANFLYGVVYSLPRVLGADIFTSLQVVIMCTGALAFLSMFWLLRGVFSAPPLLAAAFADLFAFSNLNAIHVAHQQLLVTAFMPLLLGLGIVFWRGLVGLGPRRASAGYVVAALFPLVMFTGFYVCWYVVLFLGTSAFVGVLLLLPSADGRRRLRQVMAVLLDEWALLLRLAIVFLVFLAPFAVAYIPQMVGNNGFAVDALYRSTFPALLDLFNVGPDNLVWGLLLIRLNPALVSRLGAYELLMGTPPGVFALFLLATIVAVLRQKNSGLSLAAVFAISVLAGMAMIVQFDGWSLWWLVRKVVPGAKAVRVVSRYQPVLYMFALIATALVCSTMFKGLALRRKMPGALLATAVFAFLFTEQIQPVYARMHKKQELARMATILKPPAECRTFLLAPTALDASGDHLDDLIRVRQVDAIYQAMRYRIPTINGLSSLNPRQYWFYNLNDRFYPFAAGMWIARHHIEEGLCMLDLDLGSWRPVARSEVPLPLSKNLLEPDNSENTVANALRMADYGFEGGPPNMWSGGKSGFLFSTPVNAASISFNFIVANPAGSEVTFLINGTVIKTVKYAKGGYVETLAAPSQIKSVSFQSNTFVPAEVAKSSDTRKLGILIAAMWFSGP